jgi:putative ABC transport system substrate-binding protein
VIESFRREMRNLGYLEGRDIMIEFRTAAGDPAHIAGLAAELAQASVDVIVTDGTPASLAAKQATTTIPIVMAVNAANPVAGWASHERRSARRQHHGLHDACAGTRKPSVLRY